MPTPPPLLKGGEGVRGRDGTLGIQPQRDKGCMRSQTPPPFGEGVRGRGPFERLRNFLGNYFVMHFFLKKHLSSCVYQRNFVSLSPFSFRVNLENDSKTTRKRDEEKSRVKAESKQSRSRERAENSPGTQAYPPVAAYSLRGY